MKRIKRISLEKALYQQAEGEKAFRKREGDYTGMMKKEKECKRLYAKILKNK